MHSRTWGKLLFFLIAVLVLSSFKTALQADVVEAPRQAPTRAPGTKTDALQAKPHHAGGEDGSIAPVLLSLIVVLMSAKVGGAALERLGQPSVLGELIFGVILGNLSLFGWHGLDYLKTNNILGILAEIGVIFLLFEVGLESNVKQMLEVGASSFLVALVGVISPMLLGWAVGSVFLPKAHLFVHVFIGATLCATSVGITARVLRDLGKTGAKESRIILGAAVIDDVMGLVILAAVSGIIKAADNGAVGISTVGIALIIVKAVAFLVIAIWTGSKLSPLIFSLASTLQVRGMLLATSVCFCFLLAYLANRIELAPIVGAFAAGLILDPVHYVDLRNREETSVEALLQPISSFLVPIFFVMMGLRVDLRTFGDFGILGFAATLTGVAILGKQVCSLAVLERGLDRLSIGVGMIPRGEVGLIFASLGASLILRGEPVVSASTYSAMVIMVILTTLVTPPLLKVSLARGERIKHARLKEQVLNS